MSPIINYDITATWNAGGSISPSAASVPQGGDVTFTITANAGYHIVDVQVDGLSVGAPTTYNFSRVMANHTIDATFASGDPVITASAGTGGTITPSGSVNVSAGGSQVFTIGASPGYTIAGVTVDGVSVGFAQDYTFSNVMGDHTISVTFTRDFVNAICDALVQALRLVKVSGGYQVDFDAAGSLVERNPGLIDWRSVPRPYACVSFGGIEDNTGQGPAGGIYRATGTFAVRFLVRALPGATVDKAVGERMAATVMQDIMRGIAQDVNVAGVLATGWIWPKDSTAEQDPEVGSSICGGQINFGATWEWSA